ncbi:MAG TPA: TRAM domain-containing protein, partial [Actinomycetota bacterium]|nr:TRAM domain-containing protein [Actinomycetota bacterium]
TEELIVEGVSKKNLSRLSGRTRTNKVVHFDSDGAEPGSFRTVRVSGARTHHLDGELVEGRADEPRHMGMSLPLLSTASGGCTSCN